MSTITVPCLHCRKPNNAQYAGWLVCADCLREYTHRLNEQVRLRAYGK